MYKRFVGIFPLIPTKRRNKAHKLDTPPKKNRRRFVKTRLSSVHRNFRPRRRRPPMSLEQRNASPLFFLCLSICPGGCLGFLRARVMKKVRNGRNAVKQITTTQFPFWTVTRMLVAQKALPGTHRRRIRTQT